jgi:membrane-associated HD superfamily phosphohydrolase
MVGNLCFLWRFVFESFSTFAFEFIFVFVFVVAFFVFFVFFIVVVFVFVLAVIFIVTVLPLLVLVHIAAKSASVSTFIAHKWLLASVDSLVSMQVSRQTTRVVANFAHIRFFSGVNPPKQL